MPAQLIRQYLYPPALPFGVCKEHKKQHQYIFERFHFFIIFMLSTITLFFSQTILHLTNRSNSILIDTVHLNIALSLSITRKLTGIENVQEFTYKLFTNSLL